MDDQARRALLELIHRVAPDLDERALERQHALGPARAAELARAARARRPFDDDRRHRAEWLLRQLDRLEERPHGGDTDRLTA